MKRILAAACAALALASPLSALASSAHSSHEAPAPLSTLAFDQGRPWATDEALRTQMERIRDALSQHRDLVTRRMLTEPQARNLGRTIEDGVIAILRDCKLPAGADTNMHLVVAELVQSADVLLGRANGPAEPAAARAIRATQMYATYFDHPGWVPVYGASAAARLR